MKTIKALLILFSVSQALCAQTFELGTDFNFSQPVGPMKKNMNNAFGLSLDGALRFESPFSAGVEMSFGSYGHQTTRQQYRFDDGSVTETDVNVSNNILNLFLTGKHFLRKDKNINPYLSGKVGLTWFSTTLTIQDPEDESSCHPIESDILSRDNTYVFSGGAGVRIDFQTFFPKVESKRYYFDLSVHSTQGGIVKYMNVEKGSMQPMPDQDVMAKFINTQ
ncbi:MAG TPA: outer membrane beta-barrel protein, partial [Flavitalea sp.]|nr:outer membrane beta-barrel protein [Flavitalea sp.]